jgi:WD40 repeat protein
VNGDGSQVSIGFGDNTLQIWDVPAGTHRKFKAHSEPSNQETLMNHRELQIGFDGKTRLGVTSVAFGLDGKTVVSSGLDRMLKYWDSKTGEAVASVLGHSANCIIFSHDGSRMATACNEQFRDASIKIWDTGTRELLLTIPGPYSDLVFSHDDRRLFALTTHQRPIVLSTLADDQRLLFPLPLGSGELTPWNWLEAISSGE